CNTRKNAARNSLEYADARPITTTRTLRALQPPIEPKMSYDVDRVVPRRSTSDAPPPRHTTTPPHVTPAR
ncbi:hypothetical protein, partial [Curtobacterium flaccumfaciens]|uniref:hypothetical protein n=1 Tax=Curtobacterium flaccumfaciens TaxID=2035 RepID=UPI00217D8DAA